MGFFLIRFNFPVLKKVIYIVSCKFWLKPDHAPGLSFYILILIYWSLISGVKLQGTRATDKRLSALHQVKASIILQAAIFLYSFSSE